MWVEPVFTCILQVFIAFSLILLLSVLSVLVADLYRIFKRWYKERRLIEYKGLRVEADSAFYHLMQSTPSKEIKDEKQHAYRSLS